MEGTPQYDNVSWITAYVLPCYVYFPNLMSNLFREIFQYLLGFIYAFCVSHSIISNWRLFASYLQSYGYFLELSPFIDEIILFACNVSVESNYSAITFTCSIHCHLVNAGICQAYLCLLSILKKCKYMSSLMVTRMSNWQSNWNMLSEDDHQITKSVCTTVYMFSIVWCHINLGLYYNALCATTLLLHVKGGNVEMVIRIFCICIRIRT